MTTRSPDQTSDRRSAATMAGRVPPTMRASAESATTHTAARPSPKHDSVSTPPRWNRNCLYWFTHRHDHDGRWMHDFGHSK